MKTGHWRGQYPPDTQLIGISRGGPRGQPAAALKGRYKLYKALYPSGDLLKALERRAVTPTQYAAWYQTETLDRLDADETVAALQRSADGREPLLCCWERPEEPGAWCHRALVSRWFQRELGLLVPEYGFEGVGAVHPLLPAELR
jgi:hypothetical protein